MKILITGSTGYVGKLLLQEFTKQKINFIEIKRSNVKSTSSSLSIDYESIARITNMEIGFSILLGT